ncbi:MAG: DUF1003 domain-containing protein [Trueperella sp.]|nr:DUF1003 domain-containing protein [Trueperella sp.]
MAKGFEEPLDKSQRLLRRAQWDSETVGIVAERIARFTGTPTFLIYLTVFVGVWLAWNTLAPEHLRFDSASLGFTALTLMLSLQASYAAPLILLAQNRQDDRDRVSLENDRLAVERNIADTEYLTRELAALRVAVHDLATRDFVRAEMRDQLAEHHKPELGLGETDPEIVWRDERIAQLEQRLNELEATLGEPSNE